MSATAQLQPLPTPVPRGTVRPAIVATPVCDGCGALASLAGWHRGAGGAQLCQACWGDCGDDTVCDGPQS